jgi:CBS domain-containing protein
MQISELCRPDVVTVKQDISVQDAAEIMQQKTVGSLVVVDDNCFPIGMITDRDIAVKVVAEKQLPAEVKVSQVMCKDVLMLSEQQDLTDAIDALCEKGVRRAPVLDEQNNLCGIVAIDDVMACIIDELNGVMEIIRAQSKQFDINDMANQGQTESINFDQQPQKPQVDKQEKQPKKETVTV